MTPEHLFFLASAAVVPGWALLVLAPRWKWTARMVGPVILPVLMGLLYVYLIAAYMPGSPGGLGSLKEVRLLFDKPQLLLAGWVHYLALDLFTGSWEVRDSARLGIHHGWVVPCLVLTFLFGPLGLLLYLALRAVLARKIEVD